MIALKILATLIPIWILITMLFVILEYLAGEIDSWDDFWHTVISASVFGIVLSGMFSSVWAVVYLAILIWR